MHEAGVPCCLSYPHRIMLSSPHLRLLNYAFRISHFLRVEVRGSGWAGPHLSLPDADVGERRTGRRGHQGSVRYGPKKAGQAR
jgi:hypothetical protein